MIVKIWFLPEVGKRRKVIRNASETAIIPSQNELSVYFEEDSEKTQRFELEKITQITTYEGD